MQQTLPKYVANIQRK